MCVRACAYFAYTAEKEMLCFNSLLISKNVFYKSAALLKSASGYWSKALLWFYKLLIVLGAFLLSAFVVTQI